MYILPLTRAIVIGFALLWLNIMVHLLEWKERQGGDQLGIHKIEKGALQRKNLVIMLENQVQTKPHDLDQREVLVPFIKIL